MARTRSVASACWWAAKSCSGRWPRCRPPGGCWTASDQTHLPRVQQARAQGRGWAWAAGVAADLTGELCLDFDATITVPHSEKENAAATWKKTFGFHPLLCFLDRPDVAAG